MTKKSSLETRVREIPGGEGWWKSGSERWYLLAARKLVGDNGFTEDEAIDFLSRCYWAVADCFGG